MGSGDLRNVYEYMMSGPYLCFLINGEWACGVSLTTKCRIRASMATQHSELSSSHMGCPVNS